MKSPGMRALVLAAASLLASPSGSSEYRRSNGGNRSYNLNPKRNPAGTKLWRKTQRGGLV
jgi:hypothetical protein